MRKKLMIKITMLLSVVLIAALFCLLIFFPPGLQPAKSFKVADQRVIVNNVKPEITASVPYLVEQGIKTEALVGSQVGEYTMDRLRQFSAQFPNNIDYSSDEWCFIQQVSADSLADGMYEEEAWRERRGYVSANVTDIYENYPSETLEQLASNGDMAAYGALNIRISQDAIERARAGAGLENYNKMMKQRRDNYLEAAARGSSNAFRWMATKHLSESKSLKRSNDFEKSREEFKESMAYFGAAFLRNDYTSLSILNGHILKRYEFEPTPSEITQINNRSKAILEEVRARREELGLGPFDDYVPNQRRRFDQLRFAGILADKSHLWLQSVAPEKDHCTEPIIKMQRLLRSAGEYLAQSETSIEE